jgi:BirA family biotin operon repressor/biotin-[acetyl-CoA-carboxylase] ligase
MPWTSADAAVDPALTREFAACLPGGRLAGPLRAYRAVPSTQDVARAWADAGAPEGAVVLADHQTAGRGRRGRRWTASPGRGLLFSVILRPPMLPARWPELALLAGCAVAEGIEEATGVPTRLRWPNDVLVAGRKVAGILAEGTVGATGVVVLGIGVNVGPPEGDWPPELAGRATAVAAHAPGAERAPLLAAILARLDAWYATWLAAGFEPVRAAWGRRGVLGGRVASPGPGGVAVAVAPGGGLVVRHDDGTTSVLTAGEPEAPPVPAASAG